MKLGGQSCALLLLLLLASSGPACADESISAEGPASPSGPAATIAQELLTCSLGYLVKGELRPVPGGMLEARFDGRPLELSEENRDLEYKVTIEGPKENAGSKTSSSETRGFRVVLRNKRSDLIGHMDGQLALLRNPLGATLRLQAPEGVNTTPSATEVRITCALQ